MYLNLSFLPLYFLSLCPEIAILSFTCSWGSLKKTKFERIYQMLEDDLMIVAKEFVLLFISQIAISASVFPSSFSLVLPALCPLFFFFLSLSSSSSHFACRYTDSAVVLCPRDQLSESLSVRSFVRVGPVLVSSLKRLVFPPVLRNLRWAAWRWLQRACRLPSRGWAGYCPLIGGRLGEEFRRKTSCRDPPLLTSSFRSALKER